MKKLKLFFITIGIALIIGILGSLKLNYVYAEEVSVDFSSANFNITENYPDVEFTITGIKNANPSYSYYFKITGSTEEPTTNYSTTDEIENDGWTDLTIDDSGNTTMRLIESSVELNQDLYLWVLEFNNTAEEKVEFVLKAKKIERPKMPKYAEVFNSYTNVTSKGTILSFNIPWAAKTIRKFDIKIGKVTDNEILQSIKNGESNAFERLTTYAKSTNSIYQEKLSTSDTSVSGRNDYDSSNGVDKRIELSNVEDGAYYYLYVNFDDESGKYYPIEGITLCKAEVPVQDWYMFFLGNDDFTWDDFSQAPVPTGNTTTPEESPTTPKQDQTTTTKSKLPKTGEGLFIITAFVIIVVMALWLHSKNKKYDGI